MHQWLAANLTHRKLETAGGARQESELNFTRFAKLLAAETYGFCVASHPAVLSEWPVTNGLSVG